jgi:hypothetical protein
MLGCEFYFSYVVYYNHDIIIASNNRKINVKGLNKDVVRGMGIPNYSNSQERTISDDYLSICQAAFYYQKKIFRKNYSNEPV